MAPPFPADFSAIRLLCQIKYRRSDYFKGLLKPLLAWVPEIARRVAGRASWPFPAAPFPMITG